MNFEGKWNLVVTTPWGQQQLALDIATDADGYRGTLSNTKGHRALRTVKVMNGEARFEGDLKTPFGDLQVSFFGVVSENKIFGRCKSLIGTSDFSGVRGS